MLDSLDEIVWRGWDCIRIQPRNGILFHPVKGGGWILWQNKQPCQKYIRDGLFLSEWSGLWSVGSQILFRIQNQSRNWYFVNNY